MNYLQLPQDIHIKIASSLDWNHVTTIKETCHYLRQSVDYTYSQRLDIIYYLGSRPEWSLIRRDFVNQINWDDERYALHSDAIPIICEFGMENAIRTLLKATSFRICRNKDCDSPSQCFSSFLNFVLGCCCKYSSLRLIRLLLTDPRISNASIRFGGDFAVRI